MIRIFRIMATYWIPGAIPYWENPQQDEGEHDDEIHLPLPDGAAGDDMTRPYRRVHICFPKRSRLRIGKFIYR
mgnify:CR=1 FL=1